MPETDESQTESNSDSIQSSASRNGKRRGKSSKSRSRAKRRRRNDEFLAYEKYARWQARSLSPFVDYFALLDIGLHQWEKDSYGKLSQQKFCEVHRITIDLYINFRDSIPDFQNDFSKLMASSRRTNRLAKAMHEAAAGARGDDIASLNNAGMDYIALEEPDKILVPPIPADADKKASRGHNHVVLSRLLCPARLLEEFDANPNDYMKDLRKGVVKVRTCDFPSFFYPKNGYDPEDLDAGLLRNPVIVRFFRHIFTSPGSALLENGGRTKAKGCQAKINRMKEVTPGSIAYAHLLFRHFISGVKDWRIEDDLFNRDEFHQMICDLFELDVHGQNEWATDTLEWWNMKIFGTIPTNVDEDDIVAPEASSINTLKEQRARKASEKAVATGDRLRSVTPQSVTWTPETRNHGLPPSSPPRETSPLPEFSPSPPPSCMRRPLADIRVLSSQNIQDMQPLPKLWHKPSSQPTHRSSPPPPRASTSSLAKARYSQALQHRPDASGKMATSLHQVQMQSSPIRPRKVLPAR